MIKTLDGFKGYSLSIREVFNKPKEYFSLDSIRKGYQSDRRLSLWEILDKVFGRIQRFKSKDDLAQEEFDKFLVDQGISNETFYEARDFFNLYLIDESFRVAINQRQFNRLASNPTTMQVLNTLGKEQIESIVNYIQDNVHLNNFN